MNRPAEEFYRTVKSRLLRDELGQDLVEYGLLAALIAVVATAVVGTLGNKIHAVLWQYIVGSNV